jgi:hypothetical protein
MLIPDLTTPRAPARGPADRRHQAIANTVKRKTDFQARRIALEKDRARLALDNAADGRIIGADQKRRLIPPF